MSSTRRTLGSLDSLLNVGGEEAISRRVGPELTHVERQCIRMYARREEAWRTLVQARVAAFMELFLRAMLRQENGRRDGVQQPATASILINTLRNRIIPWIHRCLVWTMDDLQWPMTMEHFEELDMFMAAHLRHVRAGRKWQMITYFYGEVEKQQEEEERQREAFEARQRAIRRSQVRRVLFL